MRDFHQSRGRILFEVFCAFAVAASCAGAWMQTGASALLPVALVALLYGVVHAFDLARRNPAGAADPQRIDFATDQHGCLLAAPDSGVPLAAADQLATTDMAVEEVKPAKPATPSESKGRRAKAPRKSGGRSASEPKETKATERAPLEEAEVAVPVDIEKADVDLPLPPEEDSHVPLAPLFEPEPFARQQRTVFGRKAG
ncbi:hypothetical protein LVY65_12295 [Sphingomonas sp. G124]|uniref:Uncharacterized protein n=1 Tax=Sphingomonas cremea TaxID=2904799 RepID=A0A9X1QLD7_9SPHN|nr:hypothetical protein [Sphingomonas cremea]MCF2515836.1 hypothetical protein [Sphingomonas cremea]